MRYLPLLLVFALSACAPAVLRPPGEGGGPPGGGRPPGGGGPVGSDDVFLLFGTSNANNLNRRAADDFVVEYARLTDCEVALDVAAWGGRRLIPDDLRSGDWNPDSRGEMYDRALNQSRPYLEENPRRELHGLIWTQGNDLLDIAEGEPGYTLDRYFTELEDILDAFTRDYGVPIYLIQAGTIIHGDLPIGHEYREREAAVCEAHPNCDNVAQLTDEIYALAEACADLEGAGAVEACERRYWHDLRIHWGDDAAEMIMEEAARNIAAITPSEATCQTPPEQGTSQRGTSRRGGTRRDGSH